MEAVPETVSGRRDLRQGFFFVECWPGLHFGAGGRNVCAGPKDAITARPGAALSTHAPLPEHDPVQPLNAEFFAAAATSCTRVPRSKVALQWPGQTMPAGRLVTAPAPLATFWITTETKSCATNFATTVCAELIVTTHGSAVHPPLHPTNRVWSPGSAESSTFAP